MAELGNRLRNLRKEAGLSQRVLAEKVDVSFTHISKIENDRETPSADLLIKIAEVVGVPQDELLMIADRIPEDLAKFVVQKAALAPRFLRSWKDGDLTDEDVEGLLSGEDS